MASKSLENFMFGEDGVVRLIGEGRYARALQVIVEEGDDYPEVARTINYHRICLAATLGDIPQALGLLERMLNEGIYYPPTLLGPEADPPGLAPLVDLPEFKRLKDLHRDCYREAMKKTPPVLVTVRPGSPAAGNPPLLVALHGNVSNVENEIDYYRPVTEHGWILAMPQSSQPWGMEGRYVWGDWEVAAHQLEQYWALLGQQTEYDPLRVVLAGISKGGEVAVRLALSGMIPAQGFVAIAPGGPHIEEPQRLLPLTGLRNDRGVRGYLIVGDKDTYCYEPTMRLAAFLREQGIPYDLEIHPGLTHWFPEDFDQSLKRALQFITDGT